MPRRAKSRAKTGDSSRSCCNRRASVASPSSSRQRRPEKLLATPKAASDLASGASDKIAPVTRLDPAHRAGGRTHHHAFGRDVVAVAMNPGQHRAVGDAGGGKHHIAGDQIGHGVFAVEVLDADAFGTTFLVFLLEH